MATESGAQHSLTYQINTQLAEMGRKVYRQVIDEESKDPMDYQTKFLMQVLKENADCEYGKKYDFSGINTIEDYQKKVPIVTYDDLLPYFNRMVEAEQNILTTAPINHMNRTTGSTGAPKRIPMSPRQVKIFEKYNFHFLNGLKAEHLTPEYREGRIFCPVSGRFETLPSGITVGSASAKAASFIDASEQAKRETAYYAQYTSPTEAVRPDPDTNATYLHILFAAMDKNITGIVAGFFSSIQYLLFYFYEHRDMIIHDIETGTIDLSISLSESARKSVQARMTPNPERAAELREIFKTRSSTHWADAVWPKLCYMNAAGGGGFSFCLDQIHRKYATTPSIYVGVNASECLFSIPVKPGDPSNLLAPDSSFLEFLPVEAGRINDFSQVVTLDKVEVGKTYETIVTTVSGLYRYRIGDAVTVTGMLNSTPLIEYAYRANSPADICGEKTNELHFTTALQAVAKKLNFELIDYSVYADVERKRYVIFVQPDERGINTPITDLAQAVTSELSQANPAFREALEQGNITAPDIRVLPVDAAARFYDHRIAHGALLTQLKPVHNITNDFQRDFFFSLVQ